MPNLPAGTLPAIAGEDPAEDPPVTSSTNHACRVCVLSAGGDNGGPPCHRCPDRGGIVVTGCWGTAARARSARDLSQCTCERSRLALLPVTGPELGRLIARVESAIDRPLTSDERNLFGLGVSSALELLSERRAGGAS
jgi:hypothetical protein